MKLGLYWRYSTRSLIRGGQRTLLAIFCVAVGVMAIVSLQLVGNAIDGALTSNVRNGNGDLAERTATHQSSVSVVVRRLVERGYVTRTASAADKRRIQIEVTPTGRSMLADAPATIQSQLIASLNRMSGDEQAKLADLLERWLQGAAIDFASPPMLGELEDGEVRAS